MVGMQPPTQTSLMPPQPSDPGPDCQATGLEPPLKKIKSDDIDPIIHEDSVWSLEAVLGDDATSPVPLVSALAAEVIDKTQTSNLIRKLNQILPLPSLQHLKRVKSYRDSDQRPRILLLLWQLDEDASTAGPDDANSAALSRLIEAGVELTHLSVHLRREQVAKFAPLTRGQFESLKASPDYWPCNFHEDKYFESLVTGSHELWSTENRLLQQGFMHRALGAREGVACGGGGVVVDPNTNQIVAEGHGTEGHPLHHTVMNLLDLVARSQGGGAMDHTAAYSSLKYNGCHSSHKKSGRRRSSSSNSISSCNGIAAMSETPLADERLVESEQERAQPASHNHLKRYGSIAQLCSVPKTGPYLCTGYDVYLEREPCHMCSMALIHMRTRRVFYSRSTRDGALGTLDKLHTLEGLNHRFEVFRGILQDAVLQPSHRLLCC